jgi:uncharacterized membrane protein YedE/YeeE
LTEEEKKAKKIRDELSNAKAKELLGQYIKKYSCLMFWGFFFNVTGMVGEFVTPLFIGMVIDAITEEDYDYVSTLVIYWMIFNVVSTHYFNGLKIIYNFRLVPFFKVSKDTSLQS